MFSYVTARVPKPGETPKLEVVSGDLNSLASGKPVIRRVWELILRAHNMISLPVRIKDAKAMIPPAEYWAPERVKEMRDQWASWDSSEEKERVSQEYPDDPGMRALMWYDCMAIATRTDRAVACFTYGVNAMANLLSDFRTVNRKGETARGKNNYLASGVNVRHGLSLVQIHTPFTSRHFLMPQDNPALSLFGNKDHETNTDQLTAVANARQRWVVTKQTREELRHTLRL